MTIFTLLSLAVGGLIMAVIAIYMNPTVGLPITATIFIVGLIFLGLELSAGKWLLVEAGVASLGILYRWRIA